jgi:O-methyltransferase
VLQSIISKQNLDAMVNLVERLPKGDFAEVGVYHGGSAWELYKVSIRQGRKLYLFDTFKGTPVFTEGLDKHRIDGEFADEHAIENITKFMPLAELHIGVYPATHPYFMKDLAFVHCDCDQYISYCDVIEKMWPLVVPGGVLLFDDYPYLGGAKKAVEEKFDTRLLQRCGGRYYVVKDNNSV